MNIHLFDCHYYPNHIYGTSHTAMYTQTPLIHMSVYWAPLTRGNVHARIQLHGLSHVIDGQAVCNWAHANSPIEAQEICSYSGKYVSFRTVIRKGLSQKSTQSRRVQLEIFGNTAKSSRIAFRQARPRCTRKGVVSCVSQNMI